MTGERLKLKGDAATTTTRRRTFFRSDVVRSGSSTMISDLSLFQICGIYTLVLEVALTTAPNPAPALVSPSVALSGECHDYYGNKDRCVTAAIYNYTMQLRSYAGVSSVLKYNLTEALLFLSHFVGEAHQPLHLGFLGDLGGNKVKLRWYDNDTNLHQKFSKFGFDPSMG